MEDHGLAVGREVDVGFQEIDAEGQRVAEGQEAVLGPERGAASMGGDQRLGVGGRRRGEEEQCGGGETNQRADSRMRTASAREREHVSAGGGLHRPSRLSQTCQDDSPAAILC